MKSLFQKILTDQEVLNNPPVLVDIGASGEIHKIWRFIAPHSICIAFDADTREFNISSSENTGYKKLYKINSIVTQEEISKTKFYLTESPYCSSTLLPREKELQEWSFADKFKVNEEIQLNAVTLTSVLEKLGLKRIDWFKTDSQGTDLRLFTSIPEEIQKKAIVAEFEPGIIDSYLGEDKFYKVIEYLEKSGFWLSDMTVKGSKRIKSSLLEKIAGNGLNRKLTEFSLKTSPGWTELTFINNFHNNSDRRSLLLGWLFSTILDQHGFALGLTLRDGKVINEPLFAEMHAFSVQKIRNRKFHLRSLILFARLLTDRVFK